MQDLVISAISTYNYDKIKCWVNSLEMTGYSGRKMMIAFNILDETIDELSKHGFDIVLASNNRNKQNNGYEFQENFTYQVPMARHFFYWLALREVSDIRYVISTDLDVIFQENPSEWLEKNLGDKKLNYGCEALKYKDEPWGSGNFYNCFGTALYQHIHNTPIYNAGTMAGELSAFRDFSLNVATTIQGIHQNPTPDQAGVNLLLSLEPYKSITKFNDHDTNWACQCGTTVDPTKIHDFRQKLLSPEPTFDGEYVYNSKGEKYVMVHQYNRVPTWQAAFEKKYG